MIRFSNNQRIVVFFLQELSLPPERVGGAKSMPILIIINTVAAAILSFLGLFGSCCRYPVKRVIETPVNIEGMSYLSVLSYFLRCGLASACQRPDFS